MHIRTSKITFIVIIAYAYVLHSSTFWCLCKFKPNNFPFFIKNNILVDFFFLDDSPIFLPSLSSWRLLFFNTKPYSHCFRGSNNCLYTRDWFILFFTWLFLFCLQTLVYQCKDMKYTSCFQKTPQLVSTIFFFLVVETRD